MTSSELIMSQFFNNFLNSINIYILRDRSCAFFCEYLFTQKCSTNDQSHDRNARPYLSYQFVRVTSEQRTRIEEGPLKQEVEVEERGTIAAHYCTVTHSSRIRHATDSNPAGPCHQLGPDAQCSKPRSESTGTGIHPASFPNLLQLGGQPPPQSLGTKTRHGRKRF